jgi:alpha-galactosidase
VYLNHPEWLVHNTSGKPILLGNPLTDHLYVLDSTHPGAQEYLKQTYSTMVDK